MANLQRYFTEHPKSVGETYLGHAGAALRIGGLMLSAGLACLVHAVFPFLFKTTATRQIKKLNAIAHTRTPLSERA